MKKIFSFLWSPSVVGIIGLVSFSLAIYTSFFYEKKPTLHYEVISNNWVLDIREKLSKLDVTYNGASLKDKNQALRIITFRISNIGNAEITKPSFDENEPLGFKISSGEILEIPEVRGNEYFSKHLKAKVLDANTVTFSPVIIEPQDFFEIKLLLLMSDPIPPKILPIGKVSGIKHIEVTEPYKDPVKKDFFDQVIDGNILVHLSRFTLYIISIVSLLILTSSLQELGNKQIKELRIAKRRKLISEFKSTRQGTSTHPEEFLFNCYINRGKDYLIDVINYLKNPNNEESVVHTIKVHMSNPEFTQILYGSHFLESEMVRGGIVSIENKTTVTPGAIEVAQELLGFIESQSAGNSNK